MILLDFFSWKGTFPVSPLILYHLYIFYTSFIFDSDHILFTSFTTFGVYSLLFYRPTFFSINTSSASFLFLFLYFYLFLFSPIIYFQVFLSLFSLSCFCTVVDIYNHSDLLSFSTKVSSAFLMLCSFSCLSCGVFCVSLELRITLEVSSADELKLFVVGGVEIFLLLLLSLAGLRSDTLSGPRAFTNTKKKLLLCF